MKLKDALVGLLTWLGILALIFFVGSVDSAPKWFLVVVAVLAWAFYILVVIRDHSRWKRRRPLFYIQKEDEWIAIDQNGEVMPGVHPQYHRGDVKESQE